MPLQKSRHGGRVGLLVLDPWEQCSQAPQRHIGIEGGPHHAGEIGPGGQSIHIRLVGCDDSTADYIGVAIEELGRGMYHEIRAEHDRPLQCRRQERIVYRDLGAGSLDPCRNRPNIEYAQQWVARRFDQYERRGTVQGRG